MQFSKIRGGGGLKNPKNNQNKKISKALAFSLIELSIVLIIIGLLVAGVTGGASLIQSAKTRALINELNGYKQAVYTFKAAKDRLPGDLNSSGKIGYLSGQVYTEDSFPAPYNTKGNGYDIPTPITGPFVDLYLEKIIDFMPIKTNEIKDTWTLNKTSGVPVSKAIDAVHYYESSRSRSEETSCKYQLKNGILLTTFDSKTKINPKLLRIIDEKIDDSEYNSGNFRGFCQGTSKLGNNSYNNAEEAGKHCEHSYYYIGI